MKNKIKKMFIDLVSRKATMNNQQCERKWHMGMAG